MYTPPVLLTFFCIHSFSSSLPLDAAIFVICCGIVIIACFESMQTCVCRVISKPTPFHGGLKHARKSTWLIHCLCHFLHRTFFCHIFCISHTYFALKKIPSWVDLRGESTSRILILLKWKSGSIFNALLAKRQPSRKKEGIWAVKKQRESLCALSRAGAQRAQRAREEIIVLSSKKDYFGDVCVATWCCHCWLWSAERSVVVW